MQNQRERRTRNRGKNGRTPTVWQIKQAICTHERLTITEAPTQQTAGGVWRTRLTCPSCGAWEVRETPDSAAPAAPPLGEATTEGEAAWETCVVELRCQERGARVYPLCRYDAIALGPAGRYVAARSANFDNGLEQAERAAIATALVSELTADGWEAVVVGADPMPHFRRRVGAAAGTLALG
jgi:hypothetical protein